MSMRGLIFTTEALIALLFFSSAFALLLSFRETSDSDLPDFVFLSDAYEVMEKGYHSDLSSFASTGNMTSKLSGLLVFIESQTGKTVFLRHGQHRYPSRCEETIVIKRMSIYPDAGAPARWHEISMGLCG